MALDAQLHERLDRPFGEPFRVEDFDAGPADAADALNLAALHRQRDLAAAGIARHQLELGVEQVVQHHRKVTRRGAVAARADDQFVRQYVLEFLHRRVGAHEADVDVAVGVAEIEKFGRIVLHRRTAEQRLQDRAGKDRAGHGAVLRRDGIDVTGRAVRSGAAHVLHYDRRIAGDVIAKIAREQGAHRCRSHRRPTSRRRSGLACLCRIARRIPVPLSQARGCQHTSAGDESLVASKTRSTLSLSRARSRQTIAFCRAIGLLRQGFQARQMESTARPLCRGGGRGWTDRLVCRTLRHADAVRYAGRSSGQ